MLCNAYNVFINVEMRTIGNQIYRLVLVLLKFLFDNSDTKYTEAPLAMTVSNEATELNDADKVCDNNVEWSKNVNKYLNLVNNVTNCTNCNITITNTWVLYQTGT